MWKDAAQRRYVTGTTLSTDFPTANPLQAGNGGNADAFVAKLNPGGSALLYASYLGGSDVDSGGGIALDSAGNAYVTGYPSSTNFPTASPLKAIYGGNEDVFVQESAPCRA
jgi:hypothetical protein